MADTAKEVFARNLQNLMEAHGESQEDIARIVGVAQQTVSDWLRARKYPRIDKVEILAKHYQTYKSNLTEDKASLPEGAYPYAPTHKIAILGRISAGLPLYAEEHIEGYAYTDLNGGAEYFGLKVRGDSMDALKMSEGDTLIVRRQEDVENGDIAVVLIDDQNATVKRFYREGRTVTLVPQSTNPEHQIQVYDASKTKIKVLGKVVRNQIDY